MEFIKRQDIIKNKLTGRIIEAVVGKNNIIPSNKMTICFATYSKETGKMEPHNHAEETVVILNCCDGWVKFGSSKEDLSEKIYLEKNMILHFDELEWHVFGYDNDGYIEALCIYGQVDNIRPEDILQSR